MITAGIDAGSRSTKVVILDSNKRDILAKAIADQGIDHAALAEDLLSRACADCGAKPNDLIAVVATGYGRNSVRMASKTVTEITCHARGVRHFAPDARTIIEIGGQDSKCIFLEETGRVRDFNMNDRCAAGSGRFLEVVAQRLGMPLCDLCDRNWSSDAPPPVISSMCVVFAETEIIGLLAQGAPPADIAAGVQNAIASRVSAMLGRNLKEPVLFTGGVALQPGMVRALEQRLGCALKVCSHPQFTGAVGAALLAAESIQA